MPTFGLFILLAVTLLAEVTGCLMPADVHVQALERIQYHCCFREPDPAPLDPDSLGRSLYNRTGLDHGHLHSITVQRHGAWHRIRSALNFDISPTFLYGRWFEALLVFLAVTMLWSLWSLRLRQLYERQREETREHQRERDHIAHENYDTLLQDFQGVVLRFQAVTDLIPVTMAAHGELEALLDLADRVLADGRYHVPELSAGHLDKDLSEVVAQMAVTLLAGSRKCETEVEGTPRPLHPIVMEEVTQIARTAILNACRDAGASHVEILVVYHPKEFRLLVCDDGERINRSLPEPNSSHMYYGLADMKERSRRIRAELVISSRVGLGTKVGLTVPRQIAYLARTIPPGTDL